MNGINKGIEFLEQIQIFYISLYLFKPGGVNH